MIESAGPLPAPSGSVQQIHAVAQKPDALRVRQLSAWSGQAPGVAPCCTNASAYPDAAKPRGVMGPGSIDQAHGVAEWVEGSGLEKLAGVYARWWDLA